MNGAPLVSSFTTFAIVRLGPTHTANDLRSLKTHMDSGGTVYVQRAADSTSTIATAAGQTNMSQPRAGEMGHLMRVDLVASNLSELGRNFELPRQVYISRTEDHLAAPKIQRCALVTKSSPHASSDTKSSRIT